jgi:peptide/nickel transport system substrate-binding protein
MKGFCIGRLLCGALGAAALMLASCREREEGPVRVTVIGEAARIVDPAALPLSRPTEVLLGNAAQGLVRFDAQGNIEAGLAERWNVSDDGLSYIFRLQTGRWPSGRKITAYDVARLLRRQLTPASRNPLKDAFGAVDQIVAMTDRVLEIRLRAPRPHLLQLLAQPEFALVRNGEGTGPFAVAGDAAPSGQSPIRLERDLGDPDDRGEQRQEVVTLAAAEIVPAVRGFLEGRADMVLGGTFVDAPYVARARLPRGTLRFDPAAGLFGLIPAREAGLLANPEVRALLDEALDRPALVAALGVPDLEARASVLQPGLDGNIAPAVPPWVATPVAERRAALIARGRALFTAEDGKPPTLRVFLPEGPGSDIVLRRLQADWGPLGLQVERAERARGADLRLLDLVAPSVSPAWFLRQFRCEVAPICSEEADELLAAARTAPVAAQRNALLADAERLIREQILFLPIAAPVRWSLVSRALPGFAENRFARHTLTDLRNPPG